MADLVTDRWAAPEILPKYPVNVDVLSLLKGLSGEELFDNLRLYFGDDYNKYCLQFEAIFGIYCNRLEWIDFLSTALSITSHVVRFPDLDKMGMGKMIFHVTIPRVATASGVPSTKQATAVVIKYTEKTPISISFELSASCLDKLRLTFRETLLDKLLNIQAINTTIQAIRNSTNALQRGLANIVLTKILRKAPPLCILKSLHEPADLSRPFNKVARANMLQAIKTAFLESVFFLNRTDKTLTYHVVNEMTNAVRASIMNKTDTYITKDGDDITGVIMGTQLVIQLLIQALQKGVLRRDVITPVSYGDFIMSKENAITAITHHAIVADFNQYLENMQNLDMSSLDKSAFLNSSQDTTTVNMHTLQIGDKLVALEQLDKIYKSTVTKNPLEGRMELSFYFPLGLSVSNHYYSTVDNKVTIAHTAKTTLPVGAYFFDKDKTLQKLGYSDCLKTLCHPIVNDGHFSHRMFIRDPKEEELELARFVIDHDAQYPTDNEINNFYQRNQIWYPSTNRLKNDLTGDEFYKPENKTLYTELHPFYDYSDVTVDDAIVQLCSPRILLGNLPVALAPPEYHELRALQIFETSKMAYPPHMDSTLSMLTASLTDQTYPDLYYLIPVLIHGNAEAFMDMKDLVARCINVAMATRNIIPFCQDYDMVRFIVAYLGDGSVLPVTYAFYKQIMTLLKFIKKVIETGSHTQLLANEPLCSYLNGLLDKRLLPPFLHAFPNIPEDMQMKTDRGIVFDDVEVRNYDISNIERIYEIPGRALYRDVPIIEHGDVILAKIYYFCVVPSVTNNRACGASMALQYLIPDLFYNDDFIARENFYMDRVVFNSSPLLLQLIEQARVVNNDFPIGRIARLLFGLLHRLPENARVLQLDCELDPAQRFGGLDFRSIQHVLYDGFFTFSPLRILAEYTRPIPFHGFYCEPTVAFSFSRELRDFVANNPQFHKNDGSLPLHPFLSKEYYNWQRTPFFKYSSACPQLIKSPLTLACMHTKLSCVSTFLQTRNNIHPGFALTVVRTDLFDIEKMLYSTKASTAVIIGEPSVQRETNDVSSTFHITQDISTIDMGLGYASVMCPAYLKRIVSDMGGNQQDMFRIFPIQRYADDDVNEWIRRNLGGARPSIYDQDTIDMLTFGKVSVDDGPSILIGQKATCECIITPVTAPLSFFKKPNNPRGRSSSTMTIDPERKTDIYKALYDHTISDGQTFFATANPWASQWGSLGDIMYNVTHRDNIGYNSRVYSPCQRFLSLDDINESHRSLFKLISDYASRAKTCIDGDNEIQHICVDGTAELTEQPCAILQEAFPILSSSSQALLEGYINNKQTNGDTHFHNYLIAEVIPISTSFRRDGFR